MSNLLRYKQQLFNWALRSNFDTKFIGFSPISDLKRYYYDLYKVFILPILAHIDIKREINTLFTNIQTGNNMYCTETYISAQKKVKNL